ncbi:MAG: DUF58 domain-containing protein [Oscillospiraceae bacterium]|nr:DUF58 domain-containing protein [Oscillospiraceae bacterium]
MARRRILYALALAGVLLFQITNENYLAHFLLGMCLALPLLSLGLSLPGMLGCRLELIPLPAALDRGEAGRWQVCVSSPNGLPLSRLTLRLTAENLLLGQRERLRLKLSGVARRRPVELAADTAHCGLLELRADRVRVYDYLGLFALSPPLPPPARMLCRPVPSPVPPPVIPEGQGGRPSPRTAARRGPGEDYELREYRPGDPMRAVHWKLSSKWDELIVRERWDAPIPLPLVTLDRFGTPGELDRMLDKTLRLSRALLTAQRPHGVLWLEGDGSPRLCLVGDEGELRACLLALLGTCAPRSGPALDDRPELFLEWGSPTHRVHVTAEEGGESHGR